MICSWTSSNGWEETRYMCVSPLDITYFGPSECCEELINKLCSAFTALAKGLGIQSLCQKNPRIDTIVIQPEKKERKEKVRGQLTGYSVDLLSTTITSPRIRTFYSPCKCAKHAVEPVPEARRRPL